MSDNQSRRKPTYRTELSPEEIRRLMYERIACGHAHVEADEQAHKIQKKR